MPYLARHCHTAACIDMPQQHHASPRGEYPGGAKHASPVSSHSQQVEMP